MTWLLIGPFVLSLVMGIPISFSLGIGVLIFVLATSTLPMDILTQNMYEAAQSFPLMAIPFFVLAGELMNRSGITGRLINFVKFIFGRIRGGLSLVTVSTGAAFAGLTGSAVAETAALAKIMSPAMEKEGYDKDFSAALVASTGIMGPIIPPSTIMILYGATMNVSIGAMFMGGIIPGLLIAVLLMAVAYYIGVKRGYPKSETPITWKGFMEVSLAAALAFIMPIIIIFGIRGGVFTPTEGGAVAVAYSLLVGGFIYRSLTWKDIMQSLVGSGITAAVIMLVVAMSNPFGWVMAYYDIPKKFADALLTVTQNPSIILFLIILLLLFVGMFLEGAAIVLLLGPVLAPVAVQLGFDPVHFALVMTVAICLGMATPPVGVNLFVTIPIAGTTMERISKAIIPFIIIETVALLLIAYIPELVLWLPNLLDK